jgi:putative FmdB family regulatory protein
MPLYEFTCNDCRQKFEKLCSFSSAGGGVTCPKCQGTNTKKALSAFAARSKGSNGGTSSVGGGDSCDGCSSHNCGSCH